MRLGILMMGTGAYAAANLGVLRALEMRALEPYAVCGMGFGAWPAAQYLCAMDEAQRMAACLAAARHGRRFLGLPRGAARVLQGKKTALCDGRGLGRLICAQAGERMLALSDRRGIFPCRMATNGRRLVFATQYYPQGADATLVTQASLAFACRAAMAQPPFLSAMPWLGAPLLAQENPAWAADQLLRLGADRVLIVCPQVRTLHEPDAMELCAAHTLWALEDKLPTGVGILRLMMPADVGALSFGEMPRIAQAGFDGAQAQLDAALYALGMASCRVLPFRPRAQAISRRC